MYFPGHYAQPGQSHHGYPTSHGLGSNQAYGQQGGTDMSAIGGRMAHSGFAPGVGTTHGFGSAGASLRLGMPGMPGKQCRIA